MGAGRYRDDREGFRAPHQGGQEDGGLIGNVAEPSQDNPSKAKPDDQYFSTGGVSPEDQKQIKDIIGYIRGLTLN